MKVTRNYQTLQHHNWEEIFDPTNITSSHSYISNTLNIKLLTNQETHTIIIMAESGQTITKEEFGSNKLGLI